MIKRIFVWFIVILTAGGISFSVYQGTLWYKYNHSLSDYIRLSKQEISLLKSRLQKTESSLDEKNSRIKQQGEDIEKMNQEKKAFLSDKEKLKAELYSLEKMLDKVKQDKKALENDRTGLRKEVVSLKEEIRLYKGEIKGLSEIKLAVSKRRKSINELNLRVKKFKRAKQKVFDRAKSSIGNKGFLVKDGKTTLTGTNIINLQEIIIKKE